MPGFKYAAFISYSTRDRRFAAKLQTRLKGYLIPRRFGDIDITSQGQRKLIRRIKPVFRDTEELSSGDLNAKLKQALDDSAALVVVCSPNSAKSPWVEAEIQHFISQGRSNRIFAIIKSGIPNAPVKDADKECLPLSLRGTGDNGVVLHVVAGDQREKADGPRAAFLKVVAGIADIPFSQLLDRDTRRNRTNRRLGVGGLLGSSLAMVCGAYLWLDAQHTLSVYGALETAAASRNERLMFNAFLTEIAASDEELDNAKRFEAGFVVGDEFAHPKDVPFVFSGSIAPDEANWLRSISFSSTAMEGRRTSISRLETSYRDASERQVGRFIQDVERSEPTAKHLELSGLINSELAAAQATIERELDIARSECERVEYGFRRTLPLDEAPMTGVGEVHCTGPFVASYSLILEDQFPKNWIVEILKPFLALLAVATAAWLVIEAAVSLRRSTQRKMAEPGKTDTASSRGADPQVRDDPKVI